MSCTAAANGPSGSTTSVSTHSGSGGAGTTQACAACKFQRRKCHPECPLAPYFPPDQPKQFLNVHKLYGVSNTLRILKQVDPSKRHDAMKSILYEADARDRDPVHGCYGIISFLQTQAEMLREELEYVRAQVRIQQQQQQQMLTAAQATYSQLQPLSMNHLSSISHGIHTVDQSQYQYTDHHHNQLANINGVDADLLIPSCTWPQQLNIVASSPTITTTPSWLQQYMASSPHYNIQTPAHVAVDAHAYMMTSAPQLNVQAPAISSLGASPPLVKLPVVSVDVRPSFDARSLVDYESAAAQHSFDHDSAPKLEHAYESSAESSVKDPQSLEQEDLESATALFTLTSSQSQ